MRVLFQDFLSSKDLFFDQFDHAAQNLNEMANLLIKFINTESLEEREYIFKRIDNLEHSSDDITHKIFLNLNKIVFTPLHRNDIHDLAAAIDDVSDAIHEACNRMYLYTITDFVLPIKEIAAFIAKAGRHIENSIVLLRNSKKSAEILELCRQVKQFERQAGQVYYNAVAALFLNDKNAINLIKYHEIFLSLETAVNKCKSVSDLLGVVLVNG